MSVKSKQATNAGHHASATAPAVTVASRGASVGPAFVGSRLVRSHAASWTMTLAPPRPRRPIPALTALTTRTGTPEATRPAAARLQAARRPAARPRREAPPPRDQARRSQDKAHRLDPGQGPENLSAVTRAVVLQCKGDALATAYIIHVVDVVVSGATPILQLPDDLDEAATVVKGWIVQPAPLPKCAVALGGPIADPVRRTMPSQAYAP
jgi:hypothetical protein